MARLLFSPLNPLGVALYTINMRSASETPSTLFVAPNNIDAEVKAIVGKIPKESWHTNHKVARKTGTTQRQRQEKRKIGMSISQQYRNACARYSKAVWKKRQARIDTNLAVENNCAHGYGWVDHLQRQETCAWVFNVIVQGQN
jgi:hypothetical protein